MLSKLTKNLKLYLLFCIVWSLLFFTALNYALLMPEQRWPLVVISALVYGVGFWIVGYMLGKRDDQSKVRYGLEDAYSATSNISSAIIGGLWILFFKLESAWALVIYFLIIVTVAFIGYSKYRKSIKGMKNKELFQ